MEVQPLARAFALRQQKNYPQALGIYQPLWQQDPNQLDDWAGWSYAYCLKETRQYQQALDVCRQLYQRFPQTPIIGQLYAGCIYYTQFTGREMPEVAVAKKAVQAMFGLCPPHQKYSLTSKAIFKLAKLLMSQAAVNWPEIESWLLKLDPDLLDDKPFSMKAPNGKTIEYASPVEEWYSAMIKVKAGLNQPNELLALLEAARKRQLKWHYSNPVWFARKEAFAYLQLGQGEKAEKILREIITRKKDWFLLQDLADMVTDPKEALCLLATAALAFGDADKKIKLYYSIFNKINRDPALKEEAKQHLLLVAAIRHQHNWPIPATMQSELVAYDAPELNGLQYNGIIRQLTPFWSKLANAGKTYLVGAIEKLLEGNQSGFVKTADGKRYYFSMREVKPPVNKAIAGAGVRFELEDGFDKKRNQATKNAVRLIIQ